MKSSLPQKQYLIFYIRFENGKSETNNPDRSEENIQFIQLRFFLNIQYTGMPTATVARAMDDSTGLSK